MEKIVFLMSNVSIAIGVIQVLILSSSIIYKMIMNKAYKKEMNYNVMSNEYKLEYWQEFYNAKDFEIQNNIRYGRIVNSDGEYNRRVIMDKRKMHYCCDYSIKSTIQTRENKFIEEERKQLIVA